MAVDVWKLKVGDKVREEGKSGVLIVTSISPPGAGNRPESQGPLIYVEGEMGAYRIAFDADTAQFFEEVS